MPAEVSVTLVCDHHSSCKERIQVTATIKGNDTDSVKLKLPYNLPKGWVVEHDRGYGSSSKDFKCYCPEHSKEDVY
jgi:hypothetical protein